MSTGTQGGVAARYFVICWRCKKKRLMVRIGDHWECKHCRAEHTAADLRRDSGPQPEPSTSRELGRSLP
jgi:hypothetical protein